MSPLMKHTGYPSMNSDSDRDHFNYSDVHNSHLFESNVNHTNHDDVGGRPSSVNYENIENYQNVFEEETYPKSNSEEIEDMSNSFGSSGSLDNSNEDNEKSFKVPNKFDQLESMEENYLHTLSQFPPLPDLHFNDFQNVEYEEYNSD